MDQSNNETNKDAGGGIDGTSNNGDDEHDSDDADYDYSFANSMAVDHKGMYEVPLCIYRISSWSAESQQPYLERR